jgi:cold shock CspA family protein
LATQGVVKTYDPITGVGVIVLDDDRSEVYLRPGSLKGSIFRMLRQGQRILFDLEKDGDMSYAANIKVGQAGY